MHNTNIKREHLGKRGLHLNDHGTHILVMNIVQYLLINIIPYWKVVLEHHLTHFDITK